MKNVPKAAIVIFITSVILMNFVLIHSCNQVKTYRNYEDDSLAIAQVLQNNLGWAKTKDFELFLSGISADSIFRSITPYKRVVTYPEGIEQNKAIWLDDRFQAISHELIDLKVQISESGNMAWFYCIVNDYNTWEGKPVNWENVRRTGVLEKRNNEWKIVQQHLSFATN